MKYRVYFQTSASLSVNVDVTEEEIELCDGDANAAAIEKAYTDMPFSDICAQCSGWGQKYSLALGEFEIESRRETSENGDVHFIETEPMLIEDGE